MLDPACLEQNSCNCFHLPNIFGPVSLKRNFIYSGPLSLSGLIIVSEMVVVSAWGMLQPTGVALTQ